MEASALHAPAGLSRLPLATALLRLRSDEQLVALFRAGSDEAFGVLHDRYRQRLFAYVRQMLSHQSRQDAEDVLQDVFVRAFGALRGDSRTVNVRAWLYRVAHNRCIDHLRRPHPPAAEIYEMSRKPLLDPVDEAQRRDDLRRLVGDVGRLPDQQRSALLMREIDGLSYVELAGALDVTVPAVKSLLVRARVGLVEAQESRDADCGEIRRDLHGVLRPRRQGVRARAPAHARVRRLPRVQARAAWRAALVRGADARERRSRRAAGEADRRRRRGRRSGRGRQRRRSGACGHRHDRDRLQGRRGRLRDGDHRGRRRRGPRPHRHAGAQARPAAAAAQTATRATPRRPAAPARPAVELPYGHPRPYRPGSRGADRGAARAHAPPARSGATARRRRSPRPHPRRSR